MLNKAGYALSEQTKKVNGCKNYGKNIIVINFIYYIIISNKRSFQSACNIARIISISSDVAKR